MDSQQVEIVGRNSLVNSLLVGGIEVAEPIRDRGVDLIAYSDHFRPDFRAVPIQLKAAAEASLSIDRKYELIPNLMMVFAWNCCTDEEIELYAIAYSELAALAFDFGWVDTSSWQSEGTYSLCNPSREMRSRLVEFQVVSSKWSERLGLSGT